MAELTHPQINALDHVRSTSVAQRGAALNEIEMLGQTASVAPERVAAALAYVRSQSTIDLNFHPDRLDNRGQTVVQSLTQSARYQNQFETGISNGGLTAVAGGERDLWEQRLFGGAYQKVGVEPKDRPKYGALNLLNYWDGACSRFGSCYFRLKPRVLTRCTFAFGDSSQNPERVATIDAFETVLAPLFKSINTNGCALARDNLSLDRFLEDMGTQANTSAAERFSQPPGRNLNEYIEVHIHGPIELAQDIEFLVVDGSFRHTDTGALLEALSARHGFALYWSPGFYLPTLDVPADFRGPVMIPLATQIAPDGMLDAVKIGQAVLALRTHPEEWQSWGTFDETLQYLKQLWHVLATFGSIGPSHSDS